LAKALAVNISNVICRDLVGSLDETHARQARGSEEANIVNHAKCWCPDGHGF
jgi:hypothetical protein